MIKKKLQEIVSNNSIIIDHDQADQLFQSSPSSLLTKSPPSSPLSSNSDNRINNTNLTLITDNNAKHINNQNNGTLIDDSRETITIEATKQHIDEMEDWNDNVSSSVCPLPNKLTAEPCEIDDDGHEGENAIRKKKLSLTLPLLNVVITDTTNNTTKSATPSPQQPPLPNKTKKFYESDDAFIQTIFSQTITSTTATPTDDYNGYPFDDFNAALTPLADQPNLLATTIQQQPESLNDDTQTEKLDMYKETLISFTDIVNIDNACKDGIGSDNEYEYNKIYENLNDDATCGDEAKTDNSCSFYENVDACDNFDESIRIGDEDHIYENVYVNDSEVQIGRMNANDGGSQLHQSLNQPLSSYFDQTIEDDDIYDEDVAALEASNAKPANGDLAMVSLITNNQINTNGGDGGTHNATTISRRSSSSSSVDYDDDNDVEDADNTDKKQSDTMTITSNINVHVSLLITTNSSITLRGYITRLYQLSVARRWED